MEEVADLRRLEARAKNAAPTMPLGKVTAWAIMAGRPGAKGKTGLGKTHVRVPDLWPHAKSPQEKKRL